MDRRKFVWGASLVGAGLASGAAAQQAGVVRVPMEVEIESSWLSWVTAANGCLRALGIDCDNVDVAGHSGYAFHMCITDVAGVEGPFFLPWSDLANGVRMLGRSTLEFRGTWSATDEQYRGNDLHAFELAKREVDAGRPCVLWGLTEPEFGIVTGYEGEQYVYVWSGHGGREVRMHWSDPANHGGAYLLMFPTPSDVPRVVADRAALVHALNFLHRRSNGPNLSYGLEAYQQWIDALRGNRADGFGNRHCAQSFSNAKEYARDFVTRLAERNDFAAGPLDLATIAYQECADAMGIAAQLFPFPGPEEENVEDIVSIDEASDALATALKAETQAAEAMERALEVEWPEG